MARRKATRPASWSATPWAISGGVELGLLDLLDVELDLAVAGDLGRSPARRRSASAPATDDDAGRAVWHVDPQAVRGALDLDAADGRVGSCVMQVVADLPVLDDVVA
jgi:hypothetical protein